MVDMSEFNKFQNPTGSMYGTYIPKFTIYIYMIYAIHGSYEHEVFTSMLPECESGFRQATNHQEKD